MRVTGEGVHWRRGKNGGEGEGGGSRDVGTRRVF